MSFTITREWRIYVLPRRVERPKPPTPPRKPTPPPERRPPTPPPPERRERVLPPPLPKKPTVKEVVEKYLPYIIGSLAVAGIIYYVITRR